MLSFSAAALSFDRSMRSACGTMCPSKASFHHATTLARSFCRFIRSTRHGYSAVIFFNASARILPSARDVMSTLRNPSASPRLIASTWYPRIVPGGNLRPSYAA